MAHEQRHTKDFSQSQGLAFGQRQGCRVPAEDLSASQRFDSASVAQRLGTPSVGVATINGRTLSRPDCSNICKEERGPIEPLERRVNLRDHGLDRNDQLPSTSEAEHSSSDTESVSTPSESPIHR
jgi:hypothetical protein